VKVSLRNHSSCLSILFKDGLKEFQFSLIHLSCSVIVTDRKRNCIQLLKSDADYHAALKEVESLMMAAPDTPEGEKLDVMVTLIEAYEAKHFPMDLPDPVEAIKFEMERKGLTVKDLEHMIGKSNRIYEILNHKRSLTLKMTWKLHEGLGIPAESLIKPPQAHA
jgi:HTH-type transcriptional regulator/antitoxin HigA